jgi:hypothetical protein
VSSVKTPRDRLLDIAVPSLAERQFDRASQKRNSENQVLWTAFNLSLVINGTLLVALFSSGRIAGLGVCQAVAIVGVLLGVAMWRIQVRALANVVKFERSMAALEALVLDLQSGWKDDTATSELESYLLNQPPKSRESWGIRLFKARNVMRVVWTMSVLAWLAFLGWTLVPRGSAKPANADKTTARPITRFLVTEVGLDSLSVRLDSLTAKGWRYEDWVKRKECLNDGRMILLVSRDSTDRNVSIGACP